VSGQTHAAVALPTGGRSPGAQSVGGCVVPRAHLDALQEKDLSRSSEIEPLVLSGHVRSHVTVRTAAVPFLKMGLM
jgi:hypothetical protein